MKYDKNSPATTRYPHSLTLLDPNQVFPVRWMSTNSVHYVDCPKCGAKAGFLCVTPTGKRGRGLTGGAHDERQGELMRLHPDIANLSRINVVKP
jgi:hypothetical protein